jgi:NAD(P)-dependent dehydrogenase (short-subunit alcohol dehydrogenase family)
VYDLTGRKALVTGGGRGLGEGIAQALTRAGAAVVIGDVREDLGKTCVDSLQQSGASAEFVPLDVTSEASWEQAIPQVVSHLGGLDIVINNAGIEISSLLVDIDADDARRMLDVNVLGTTLGIKHGFRVMRPGGPAGQGYEAQPVDDVAMIAGTGGTTGQPKGVLLTGHNIETMTALTLMSYPFDGRPAYLALAPLTHAAGVLCFPIMTLGGEIVIMPAPDLAEFLSLVEQHQITHAFLPPTLIYLLLEHRSTCCSNTRAGRGEPVVAAMPLVRRRPDVSVPPGTGHRRDRSGHGAAVRADGGADDDLHHGAERSPPRRRHAGQRALRVGRAAHALVTVAIMDDEGRLLPAGQRGEIVVRAPWSWRATTRTRPPQARPRGTGRTTPATLGTSTPITTSTSWTGPKT